MARIGAGIRAIAPTVVVMCMMGSQAAGGSAREPAVSELNVAVMGFYLGGERLESEPAFTDPTSWNDTGGISAEVTLPLGDVFGLSVSGGGRWGGADGWTASPFITTTSKSLSAFFVGVDFFWRDPTSGYFGFFYDYERNRVEYEGTFHFFPAFFGFPPVPYEAVSRIDQSRLRLGGGAYLGEFDLELAGAYELTCGAFWFDRRPPESCLDGYAFATGVSVYPDVADRIRVGLELRGGQVEAGRNSGHVSGVAFVDWQPGFHGNRSVRVGAQVESGALFQLNDSSPFVGVGISLSIALPGSDDLKQLFRELQI